VKLYDHELFGSRELKITFFGSHHKLFADRCIRAEVCNHAALPDQMRITRLVHGSCLYVSSSVG